MKSFPPCALVPYNWWMCEVLVHYIHLLSITLEFYPTITDNETLRKMIEYTGPFTLSILLHFCNQGPVYAVYKRNCPYSAYTEPWLQKWRSIQSVDGPVYSIIFRSEGAHIGVQDLGPFSLKTILHRQTYSVFSWMNIFKALAQWIGALKSAASKQERCLKSIESMET